VIVEISPSYLKGRVYPPASKSVAHRALIAAACADYPTLIKGNLLGDDVNATLNALIALGAKTVKTEHGILIIPIGANRQNNVNINVCASGSTLRFLLPLAASIGTTATFDGTKRLAERPIGELISELKNHGISTDGERLPLTVSGNFSDNNFTIDASVSSQYVSGLLMALPNVGGGTVKTVGEIVSRDYLNITMAVMRAFGINVELNGDTFTVSGKYKTMGTYNVESDWSSAGFFAIAGAKGNITLDGLNLSSTQGDKAVLDALKLAGANVDGGIETKVSEGCLNAFTFDVNNCPDAAPILAVLAAMSKGKSKLLNTARLKIKESDRAQEIVKMLNAFKIDAHDNGNSIEIIGGDIKGCEIDLPDDHRIAMSAAILAVNATGKTVLKGAECVNKSYPTFFEDLTKVGGKVNVLTV